jgi:hypothetical protein
MAEETIAGALGSMYAGKLGDLSMLENRLIKRPLAGTDTVRGQPVLRVCLDD